MLLIQNYLNTVIKRKEKNLNKYLDTNIFAKMTIRMRLLQIC